MTILLSTLLTLAQTTPADEPSLLQNIGYILLGIIVTFGLVILAFVCGYGSKPPESTYDMDQRHRRENTETHIRRSKRGED
jgi:hypothetical protein